MVSPGCTSLEFSHLMSSLEDGAGLKTEDTFSQSEFQPAGKQY